MVTAAHLPKAVAWDIVSDVPTGRSVLSNLDSRAMSCSGDAPTGAQATIPGDRPKKVPEIARAECLPGLRLSRASAQTRSLALWASRSAKAGCASATRSACSTPKPAWSASRKMSSKSRSKLLERIGSAVHDVRGPVAGAKRVAARHFLGPPGWREAASRHADYLEGIRSSIGIRPSGS